MWERRGRGRGSFAKAVGSSQTKISGLLSLTPLGHSNRIRYGTGTGEAPYGRYLS